MRSGEPSFEDALQDLASFLCAIREYLGRVVLCGGWVPYFYRHLPRSTHPEHSPLVTFDFDLVIPPDLPREPAGTLHDQLLKGDFVDICNREPPVVYYQHTRWGKDELAPIYGELLTPLEGSDVDRSGKPKDLLRIQGDVIAQQLRYLQLLLHNPLSIQGDKIQGLTVGDGTVVQIPNPASYILQKALALKHRKAVDRRKDLAYVFEIAALWFYETDRVQEMVHSINEYSPVWSRWVERARSILLRAFDSNHSEGSVSTEQVYGETIDRHLVNASAAGRLAGQFLGAVFE